MTINRWRQNIKRGTLVMVQPANGERFAAKVKYIVAPNAYSRAYGRRAMLDLGFSVGIDDCSIATPRDLFRTKLRSVQLASDTHDLILMEGMLRTSRDYAGRAITLAFLGVSAADTNRALFPNDHA